MIQIEQNDKKDIIIFNENSKQLVTNFQPYFYVVDIDEKYISLFNEKCKKFIVNEPSDILKEREKYKQTFEADIQYRERFLIDRVSVPIPKCELHIIYLDIETNYSIDSQNADKEITCITIYSTKLKKYITFVWRNDLQKNRIDDIYYFSSEHEMLQQFIKCINDIKPHIFTGWNIETFDLTYVINRCKKLGIDYKYLSPLNIVTVSKYGDVRIYGCVVFDLLNAYKKLHQNIMESYSLKSIAQKELQETKLSVELDNVWNTNIEKLIEYNKKDVELCKKINEKIGIIDFFDELRREVGCLWESLWFSSNIHDVALLRLAKKRNLVLPSKIHNIKREPFEGAIVLQPKPGIYENVICLDVKSLYPSIIMQFNLSPECLDGKDISLPNGITIANDKEGFIVELLKNYFEKRKYYKKLMLQSVPDSEEYKTYHLKQWAYKIILNSFYGYLGYPKARLYNIDIAKTIPFMGRLILQHMKKIVEINGFEVIAGDTDSLYVKMKSNDINENIVTGQTLTKKINESWDEFVKQFGCQKNNWLEVEFEKINKKMFFGASNDIDNASKKRYVYHEIWRDGKQVDKLGFVGFDIIRSDCAKVTAMITGNIFKMLLTEEKTMDEINNYVKIEREKIMKMEYHITEISIPKTVTANFSEYKVQTFHVKAALFSNKYLKTNFKKGSNCKIIYGYIEGLPKCEAFAFDERTDLIDKNIIINWKKMIEVLVDNKVNKIYNALNYGISSNNTNVEQTKLI